MARPLDPYRTLELPRDATLDEVKAAYRRLAKLYHPDSAGERALTRFLAVQAAYEALTEGPGKLRSALGGRPARAGRGNADPWASRSAGAGPWVTRGKSVAAGPSSTRSGARPGSRGGATGSPAAGGGSGTGPAEDDGAATGGRAGPSRTRGSAGPRPRRTRRAPGSTSYDGAETEPFEPEWQGASWYGGSSGTYWTINPREFADPRKHGPDYLARGAEVGQGPPKGRRAQAGDTRGATYGEPAPPAGWTAAGPTGPATPFSGAGAGEGPSVGRTATGVGRGDPPAWSAARSARGDVSPVGLVAAALLAVALVAIPFAIMAEPTAPGTTSIVPVVAFCGIAILALVRILRRDGRPRA
jgi:curved DNA-binding protein CbpA